MTTKEVATMIASMGLDYAYYQFDEGCGQQPPFIVFYYPNNTDFIADNSNYVKKCPLVIELYTDNTDFATEATVEGVLASNGFVYSREEAYIDSERMYEVRYQTEVILNG